MSKFKKKYYRNFRRDASANYKFLVIINCFLLFLCTLLLYWLLRNFILRDSYLIDDIESLEKNLQTNVYSQNEAIKALVDCLRNINTNKKDNTIITLIGPNGVGKTLTTNIVKQYFDSKLVQEVTPLESIKIEQNSFDDQYKLVILDDLGIDNLHEVIHFLLNIPDNQKLVIITIFNIQTTSNNIDHLIKYEDVIVIKSFYSKFEIKSCFGIFDRLDSIVAEKWLTKQIMKISRIKIERYESVIKNVLDSHNIEHSGLKGLYSRLLLEIPLLPIKH